MDLQESDLFVWNDDEEEDQRRMLAGDSFGLLKC